MKILLIEDDRELAESMNFSSKKKAMRQISAMTEKKGFII